MHKPRPYLPALVACLMCLLLVTACALPVPLTADAGQAAHALILTPTPCSSLPGYGPGPYKPSRIIDLDPSIPQDSKPSYMIITSGSEIIEIYYVTQAQLDAFLSELSGPFCDLGGAPPACIVGHYSGEPPGRPTCTVPTGQAQSVQK